MADYIEWEAHCEDSDQELNFFVPKQADMDMINDGDISSDEDYVPPNPYLPVSKTFPSYISVP